MTYYAWQEIGVIHPSGEWLLSSMSNGTLFKFEHHNPPQRISLQVCQTDGVIYLIEPQTIFGERNSQVLVLPNRLFPEGRRIGIRFEDHTLTIKNWSVTVSAAANY